VEVRAYSALTWVLTLIRLASAAPQLYLPEESFDFGKIIQGDIVTHNFSIENHGASLLEISKVSPSCGCTAGRLDKPKLGPGERALLEITFNSDRFPGRQNKSITLSSNDPSNPSAQIHFTAYVKTAFTLQPGYITFTSSPDSLSTQERDIPIKIVNIHSAVLNFINLQSSLPDLGIDKSLPLAASCKSGDSLVFHVRPVLKGKITTTQYGDVTVTLGFSDGRKLEKRIGATIKKWRSSPSSGK
jgi:hypothetical protein